MGQQGLGPGCARVAGEGESSITRIPNGEVDPLCAQLYSLDLEIDAFADRAHTLIKERWDDYERGTHRW